MERQEFLSKLGISLAAVCAGCSIISCGGGSKSGDPEPGGGTTVVTPPTTGTGFTADLNTELKNVGEFKITGGIIVVRLATGNVPASFTAVQVACTHEGTSINYNAAQGKFICPNHGSQFSTTGAVLLGPAAVSLKQYTVIVTGNTLTLS